MWNLIVQFINFLIKQLGSILTLLFSLLPNSPFTDLIDISSLTEYLGYMNYLIPVGKIISISTAWLGCIGIYYIIQIALRWAKVIE